MCARTACQGRRGAQGDIRDTVDASDVGRPLRRCLLVGSIVVLVRPLDAFGSLHNGNIRRGSPCPTLPLARFLWSPEKQHQSSSLIIL